MSNPNVVTKIRRGVDAQGAWIQAVISGRRLPEVCFSDPTYMAVVTILQCSGCHVPMSTPVEDDRVRDLNGSGGCHGNSTLEAILGFEKAGLIDPSPAPAPATIRKRFTP